MNTNTLTPAQTDALFDLLLLGLYADAHISLSEESKLQELLAPLPLPENVSFDALLQAAFGRVRAAAGNATAEEALLRAIAERLGTPAARKSALDALSQVLRADSLPPREISFENRARQALHL